MKISHLTLSGEPIEYEADEVTIHRGMDGMMVDMPNMTLVLGRLDKVIICDTGSPGQTRTIHKNGK